MYNFVLSQQSAHVQQNEKQISLFDCNFPAVERANPCSKNPCIFCTFAQTCREVAFYCRYLHVLWKQNRQRCSTVVFACFILFYHTRASALTKRKQTPKQDGMCKQLNTWIRLWHETWPRAIEPKRRWTQNRETLQSTWAGLRAVKHNAVLSPTLSHTHS